MKSWLNSRKVRVIGLTLLAAFVALNLSAFFHARAMTHFIEGSERTPPPEKLTRFGKLRVLLTGLKLSRPINRKTPKDFDLDYETIRCAGANGVQIECWFIPNSSNKTIVLVFHGYGASKDSFLPQAKEFHAMGYDTLLVDFYGSGGSAGNETSIGFFEADDVIAAAALAKQLRPTQRLLLYGNSMGAAAILRAVHVGKIKPDAIILECPFDRLLSTVKNRFAAMKLPSFPFAHLLVFWGGAQHGYNGFQYNPCDYAGSVECPVLLMVGEKDPRVTEEQTQNVLQNLSQKTFKRFEGLKHESYLAAQRTEWIATIQDFVEKNIR